MTFDPTILPGGPFAEIHAYWQSKKKADSLPSWHTFDILDIPALIPGITVFDIDPENAEVQIRFVGTRIIEAQGADTTGSFLSQIPELAEVQERCLDAARSRQPYYLSGLPVKWALNTFKTYNTLALPLAADGRSVDKIVFLMTFS